MATNINRRRFSLSANTFQATMVDAINANSAIMQYVLAITTTTLPVLDSPPIWWSQFESNFVSIKENANLWTSSISDTLTDLPKSIASSSPLMNANLLAASGYVTIIENAIASGQQPSAKDISSLQSELSNMLKLAEDQQSAASSVNTLMETFSGNLNNDIPSLQTAIEQANTTVKLDKAIIQNLQNDIQQLQQDIASLRAKIKVDQAEATLFVGVIALGLSSGWSPVGFILGILGTIGLIKSITDWILDQEKIKADQAQIANDMQNINEDQQTVAALNSLIPTLNSLVTLAQSAQQTMQAIFTAWDELMSDITAVVDDLESAETEFNVQDWAQLQDDLTQAQTDWNTLTDFAKQFSGLNYSTQPTVTINVQNSKAA